MRFGGALGRLAGARARSQRSRPYGMGGAHTRARMRTALGRRARVATACACMAHAECGTAYELRLGVAGGQWWAANLRPVVGAFSGRRPAEFDK